jgi:cyclopropane fatty-acyl-phospholipid synthase-like methyltransferase
VGELAVVQQRLAACRDLVARRLAVLEALAVAPGEQVLEAGCGSGLLLREIGAAVGEQGLAIGIDVSPDQLTAARSHCKDMTQVQVRVEGVCCASGGQDRAGLVDCVVALVECLHRGPTSRGSASRRM